MRKIIITVLLVVIGMAMSAQKYFNPNNPYHRVGDTIDNTCPIYHFQWWPDQAVRDSILVGYEGGGWTYGAGGIRLQYNYVEHPVDVVGIASVIVRQYTHEVDQHQEYMQLYEATDSSFELKAQVPMTDYYESESSHRILKMPINPAANPFEEYSDCPVGHQTEGYFIIKEYYFDSAITVQDSFYVGSTKYSELVVFDFDETYIDCVAMDEPMALHMQNTHIVNPNYNTFCDAADNPIWKCYSRWPAPESASPLPHTNFYWWWSHVPYFQLTFPIIDIKVDTTAPACPMVGGVHVASQMLDMAVLEWDRHEYFDSYQVAFGRRGTDPDSCRIINVSDTTIQLHLDDDGIYVAYVRAKCVFDTMGPWSAPRYVYRGMDITQDDQDGIEEAGGPRVAASPNPSTGMVRLSASEPVCHVEVFDMAGMRVYTADCPPMAMEMRLDLGRLPSGTYVVRAKTKSSEASTKVILER